jgi:Ca2+-binding EF-hand superfamily protein
LIEFDEFIELIGDHLKETSGNQKSLIELDESELYESALAVFREFDDDGSGSISTVELGNVFKRLGADPSE